MAAARGWVFSVPVQSCSELLSVEKSARCHAFLLAFSPAPFEEKPPRAAVAGPTNVTGLYSLVSNGGARCGLSAPNRRGMFTSDLSSGVCSPRLLGSVPAGGGELLLGVLARLLDGRESEGSRPMRDQLRDAPMLGRVDVSPQPWSLRVETLRPDVASPSGRASAGRRDRSATR